MPNSLFSGTVNTESIQKLANGSAITLKNHRAIARDQAGRIFQERRLLVPEDGKHESIVTQIEISDPVSQQLLICIPKEQVCQVELFSVPEFAAPDNARTSVRRAGLTVQDLGKQSIGGLETVGSVETGIIETGAIGNDSPIEIRREYWYSPLLGINLISQLDDPRIGTQKFEVSDIAVGEPDPKLFTVPSHFKLIDLRKSGDVQSESVAAPASAATPITATASSHSLPITTVTAPISDAIANVRIPAADRDGPSPFRRSLSAPMRRPIARADKSRSARLLPTGMSYSP
jgi:hypothetical protein